MGLNEEMAAHRTALLLDVTYCSVGCSCHHRDWEVISVIEELVSLPSVRRGDWWDE
jgi:hypothetical protein